MHAYVTCFLYGQSKKLVFVSVAIAVTAVHSDCLALPSNAQWPEMQPLVSWGQIAFAHLP